jgi:hypothetical protein
LSIGDRGRVDDLEAGGSDIAIGMAVVGPVGHHAADDALATDVEVTDEHRRPSIDCLGYGEAIVAAFPLLRGALE